VTNDSASTADSASSSSLPIRETQSVEAELAALRRRLSWLTVGVFLVALALLLFVAGFLAGEIDYHYGEYKLIAGACTGGVVMGFLFGWLARRACN
jgi:hypothetical protein